MNDKPEDRRNELDKFAESTVREIAGAPSVMALPAGSDRVFGAQRVAVYRDTARVLAEIKALAAAAGEAWYYRYPTKNKDGGTDWIEGPSIKLANDVARIYGNCDIDIRVIDMGDSWLFYARFTDFETGYSLTRPFQQRKGQTSMKVKDAGRALDIAFQIGASKAIRNVTVNALQTYADYGFDEAYNSLVKKIGSDIAGWRDRTVQGLGKIPVPLVNVERVIGRASKDWLAADVARVIAMMKAVADGMATVDETFPAPDKQVAGTEQTTQQDQPASQTVAKEAGTDAKATPAAADSKGAASSTTSAETQRTTAETKPAAASEQAAAGTAQKPAEAPKVPTNEREYIVYAGAWCAAMTDADAGLKRWTEEKKLRNACNVGPEPREDLKEKLDAKIAELRGTK